MSYECVLIINTSTKFNIFACLIFLSLHKTNPVKHFLPTPMESNVFFSQLIYHVTYFAHAFKSSLIHLFCQPYVCKLNVYIKTVLTIVCTNIR